MAQRNIKCTNCGHIPRDLPVSGFWYCPKCGKRMEIPHHRPRVARKFYKKPQITQKSRDQVTRRIYDRLTDEKTPDLGFKEPYLKPKINPILPKRRDKIRLFYKK
ncbi:MAG: hypothetical protein JSU57_06705 [Candidatus Heimdallarchaeota archaeon]|nr:MAG: hypothetical protein JSU57_06705 [Candidatus Heimdallarchaeota archaeon]